MSGEKVVGIHTHPPTHPPTHTRTHKMEYYLVLTSMEILPFVTTWMTLKDIMLSEIRQTQKDKYIAHMWNLNGKTHRSRE